MIRAAVTGSEGFIGREVVRSLSSTPGVEVVRISRPGSAQLVGMPGKVVQANILRSNDSLPQELVGCDVLVHLAWDGLGDFRSDRHNEQVASHRAFIQEVLDAGIGRIICAGTCLEYGLQEGELHEGLPPRPVVAYAVAKNALHDLLVDLVAEHEADLVWGRVFYPFGPGQHERSLWTSLHRAIDRGDPTFPMSPGLQVRDYLPVAEVGELFARLSVGGAMGTYNVCSGTPVVLRELVSAWIRDRGSKISIDPGVYDYPDYEPMAFWGSRSRLDAALSTPTVRP